MKKWVPIWVSAAVFGVVYLWLCYGVPGLRVKLAAEPAVYLAASLRHMALFKALVSLVPGGAAGLAVHWAGSRRKG